MMEGENIPWFNILSMSVSMSSDSTVALGLWIFGLMTKGHSFRDKSTSCYAKDRDWERNELMLQASNKRLRNGIRNKKKMHMENPPLACRWKLKGRCGTERQPCQGWWWGPQPELLVSQRWSDPAHHPRTWSPIRYKTANKLCYWVK